MRHLTDRQNEVLEFILSFFAREYRIPSSREIASHFGFCQNAAICHMRILRREGMIESSGRQWKFNANWKQRPVIYLYEETEEIIEEAERPDESENVKVSRPSKDGRSASEVRRMRHAGVKALPPASPPI